MMDERADHSPNDTLTPEEMRHPKPGVIDQRQQRIDPAGNHTCDPNDRPVPNSKQPGEQVKTGAAKSA
jgi:hypothetical protein